MAVTDAQRKKTTGKDVLRKAAKTGAAMGVEFATLITNAFGLIAALAWSDAIKAIFDKLGKLKYWPFSGPVMFAVLITVMAYVATVTLGRLSKDSCTKLCTDDKPTSTPSPRTPTPGPSSSPGPSLSPGPVVK